MKSTIQMSLVLAISALALFACNTAAPAKENKSFDLDKAKVEIQAMEDAFAAAEKTKDAKGVAAYYADDAVSYSRNQTPTAGKAAIEAKIAQRLQSDSSGNHEVYKVVDLFGNDDMLVEIGSWTTMNAAGAEQDKGYYMSYFEKRNGKYVCVRDMNVTSTPAKPAM